MADKDLAGRKALVTGSATGLGRSIALRLAERGADLIINCTRSVDEGEDTVDACNKLGAQAQLVTGDVSTEEGCARLAEAAGAWGKLDILVNNAGITRHARDHSDLDALSRQDFLDTYAVNVAGPFLMMQACRQLLDAAHKESGRASAVLNVSSIAGVTGIGSSVAYAATKGALNTMTLSLARALAPAIRVNAVCPGFIGTRWFKDRMDEEQYNRMEEGVAKSAPLGVASGPDDIADSAVFFLTDASRHVTGETLLVDAGTHLGFAPLSAR
ncbi:MAG: SDR family oxidoreductase [Henriciella sp.]|uniref:SDR family NAD(P)-dependent oxidoreductase n=1 Tax=Henriciella sp. TaxID=1968823 RepID=UPI003C71F982